MKFHLVFNLLIFSVIVSCGENKTSERVESCQNKSFLTEPALDKYYQTDIVPILSSVEDDRVYKCTTCHSWMLAQTPTLSEIETILKVIEEDTMPPKAKNFNSMNESDLLIVKNWYSSLMKKISNEDVSNSDVTKDESHLKCN